MKVTHTLPILGLFPEFGAAVGVGFPWYFAKAPRSGLDDITFPVDLTSAARVGLYKYSVAISFTNAASTHAKVVFRVANDTATSLDTVELIFPSLGLAPQQPKEPNRTAT